MEPTNSSSFYHLSSSSVVSFAVVVITCVSVCSRELIKREIRLEICCACRVYREKEGWHFELVEDGCFMSLSVVVGSTHVRRRFDADEY